MSRDVGGASLDCGNQAHYNGQAAFTIAAFHKPDAVGTSDKHFIRKWSPNQYLIYINTSSQFAGAIGASFPNDGAVGTGVWYHFAGFSDASSFRLGLNGVDVGGGGAGGTGTNTASLLLCSGADGRYGECAFWNVKLTQAELLALTKGTPASQIRPSALIGYWPLWGNASPEPDLSPMRSPATLSGTAPRSDHAPVGPYVLAQCA